MDHESLQSHDIQSPRQKFELEQQLGSGEEAVNNHFNFEEGDNPFSYYSDINKRESLSSEEEIPEDTRGSQQLKSSVEQCQTHSHIPSSTEFKPIQVGENMNSHPPIKLMQSPKGKKIQAEKFTEKGSPVNIRLLKEAEVDLSRLPQPQQSPKKVLASPNSEQRYNEELANDMLDLKNSLKTKEGKKKSRIFQFQQSPKSNFNKTFAPSRGRASQFQLEAQQMRMLVKMGFQKKKANYQMLVQWDKRRAETLALHGRMIELLQNEIDLRIKWSLENFENYQTFFKEKAKQEEKYINSPVVNTRYALQNNSLSRNVYINCSVILNSLYDQNAARCAKIADFVHLVRTNILQALTETHLASSQKQLLKVREKISTLRSSLKKYNQETQEKTNELAALFKQQSSNISNKCEKDFYRTQLSFLRKAVQQIEVQKKLGQYCLQYYHTAVQEELKRSSIIRQAMVTYSKGLKETYRLETQAPQLQQMSRNEELRLIEEYFAIDDMFDERTIEVFKQRNKFGELTLDSFSKYIQNFQFEPFDSRIILLKDFIVKYIGKDKQEQCHLVITVDNYLHLTFSPQKLFSKPDITVKITAKTLQVKSAKDDFVDIVKKEERKASMMSYFWDSKAEKVHRVRFSKKDNKQQFMDYIAKLMIN